MVDLEDGLVRQVWAGWLYALVVLAPLALLAFAAFTIGLSPLQIMGLLVVGLAPVAALVALASRQLQRVYRRMALPCHLGVRLAAIHDLAEACQTAVQLVGPWLRARAAVIALLDDGGQELTPVAAYGLSAHWLAGAPHLAMGQRPLWEAVYGGALITKPSNGGAPWFNALDGESRVVYVPLASHRRVIGVLALAGGRGFMLGDRKLLLDLGVILALGLDNCRLYEAERQRAQHMQALARLKGDFLITASHELRTPLTSIRTAAEMLLEEEEQQDRNSPRTRLARSIVKGASRLTALVADLVQVSRQEDPVALLDREPIGIGEVVSNALSQIQPLVQSKEQTMEVGIPSKGGPKVLVDRRRFEQVLVNLLSNAHRYTPSHGRLAVDVQERGDEVIISVRDSGPGIPEREWEAIFEPFYRGPHGGLGLGLAIARSLAELHGGRLWLEETGPQGSTFCIGVPRLQGQEAGAARPASGARR